MNIKAKALKNRIKNTITDKVSDVLSFPSRAVSHAKGRSADRERGILVKARKFGNAPDRDSKGMPTDAGKYRAAAEAIRVKRTR